jgi:hypothetical protein
MFTGPMFANYERNQQAFLENSQALSQELTRFTKERLQANAEWLQNLPQCTNPEKAVSVQTDFVHSTSEACMAEMPKLMEKTMQMWTAMMTPTGGAGKTNQTAR